MLVKNLLFLFILFISTSHAKGLHGKHQFKASYKSTYGKLLFNEILVKKEVKKDEFLSTIFENNKLGFENLLKISQLPDSIFNERRMRVGNTYAVIYNIDEDNNIKASKFIYEKNKIDYVIISLEENLQVNFFQKKVDTIEKMVTGIINSSLYLSMQNNEVNPLLAINLSEIYAWTIDFYKIQKGDFYKIIYTEQFVEGKSLNQFDIKASIFSHHEKELEAYFYKPENQDFGDYFDEIGGSMRHAFLKAPVKYSRISSVFQPRRFHPVQKRWKAHLGTDYAAPYGTPIYATANGTIIASRYNRFNGNYVKVKHNNMYTTQYLHMSKRSAKVGQYVKQGEIIGYVGQTGLATGPHVCYRFWKNGKQVDANRQDLPRTEPIDKEYLEDYLEEIQTRRNKILSLKIQNDEV